MASATVRTRTEVVKTEVPDGVMLELNAYESETLLDLLGRIGGISPRRDAIDSIFTSLRSAGVKELEDVVMTPGTHGNAALYYS